MPVFTHRFRDDLCAIDWLGEPFALARFADGERACIQNKAYSPFGAGLGTETWKADGHMPWRKALMRAMKCDLEGYYVGISPACCQPQDHTWYRTRVAAPWNRRTSATLFSYGNYDYARHLAAGLRLRERSVLVSGVGGNYSVPLDAINQMWDLPSLIRELGKVRDRPILVAAGPMACVIVCRYWEMTAPEHRQIIVDVGSLFDEELHGGATRMHMMKADPRAMRHHFCELHGRVPCSSPVCRAQDEPEVPYGRRKTLRKAGFRHSWKMAPATSD